MKKVKTNYAKKLARLRYQDEIIKLRDEGFTFSQIHKKINYKIARTSLKVKLSKSTIFAIAKKRI